MDNLIIDYSKSPYFVKYPYLQSKKTYETVIGDEREIDQSNNSLINNMENPFSILYKTES